MFLKPEGEVPKGGGQRRGGADGEGGPRGVEAQTQNKWRAKRVGGPQGWECPKSGRLKGGSPEGGGRGVGASQDVQSIHGLADIPTQNCLANCLTKASAKADNLTTAVRTGRLLDVDIHPDFRTLTEHRAFLSAWWRTSTHTQEKDIFFLNALRISLAPTPQEGPFHVMFCEKSTY